MKKILIAILTMTTLNSSAQHTSQNTPQICVTGEGKIRIRPDQVMIQIAIETKGGKANEVKKLNDQSVDQVLQLLKRNNIASADVMTQQVSLNSAYDYEKKKHHYVASQSISILLKDLSRYGELSAALIDAGVNRIDNVEFKSSKLKTLQSEARIQAIKDAQTKAQDYVGALNQKMGKAISVSDNSQTIMPMPMYKNALMMSDAAANAQNTESIAIGEIEVVANVSVCFELQ